MSINLAFGPMRIRIGGKGYDDDPADERASSGGHPRSWKEYFDRKFSGNADLDLQYHEEEGDRGIVVVHSRREECRSALMVRYYESNGETRVEAIDLYSGVSPGVYECYFENLMIDPKGVALMDRLLEVPLRKGWDETVFSFLGMPYKSRAVFRFGRLEYGQTSAHILSILPWSISLFDLLSRRESLTVPSMMKP